MGCENRRRNGRKQRNGSEQRIPRPPDGLRKSEAKRKEAEERLRATNSSSARWAAKIGGETEGSRGTAPSNEFLVRQMGCENRRRNGRKQRNGSEQRIPRPP